MRVNKDKIIAFADALQTVLQGIWGMQQTYTFLLVKHCLDLSIVNVGLVVPHEPGIDGLG
jgi:hypothetical protein